MPIWEWPRWVAKYQYQSRDVSLACWNALPNSLSRGWGSWSSSGTIWSLFDHLLEKKKRHVLSQKKEYLQELGEIFAAEWWKLLRMDNADIVFPTVHDRAKRQLTHGNYISLVRISYAVRKSLRGLYRVVCTNIPMLKPCKPILWSSQQCKVRKFSADGLAFLKLCTQKVFYNVAAVNKHLLQRYVQLRLEARISRLEDVRCIRHYPLRTTSLPMKNH